MFNNLKRYTYALLLLFTSFYNAAGQDQYLRSGQTARQMLNSRGETIIRFKKPSNLSVGEITSNVSIDDFRNDTIVAYVNEKDFLWFSNLKIPYDVLEPPSLNKELISAKSVKAHRNYPSYDEYLSFMNSYASEYPDICRLIEFGSTVDSRKLIAVKISDSPDVREKEPAVFYTATMHGDEPLGYVMMLSLVEHLLNGYATDPEVKDLIDRTEIWINPLANPDGAYFLSDTSVIGSTRFNRNNVDLNRDFPQIPADTRDSSERQPETLHMMRLMQEILPALAVNFHSGAEVVNYPWDTWSTFHADNSWYRNISREYADTVHAYSPEGYMTFRNNGITRGIDWYQVFGSRQDYLNYYLNGREVTIELSNNKIPAADQIENYWNYNKKSMIRYISKALTGFNGTVTDSASGNPLFSRIRIINHDRSTDNSFVFSREDNGNYFRLIGEGNYQVVFSATGHKYKITNVTVNNGELTNVDMILSSQFSLMPFPNPFYDKFYFDIPYAGYKLDVTIMDLLGRKAKFIQLPVTTAGKQEIPTHGLAPGVYIIHVSYNHHTWQFKAIKGED
jgi:hypothetical protein